MFFIRHHLHTGPLNSIDITIPFLFFLHTVDSMKIKPCRHLSRTDFYLAFRFSTPSVVWLVLHFPSASILPEQARNALKIKAEVLQSADHQPIFRFATSIVNGRALYTPFTCQSMRVHQSIGGVQSNCDIRIHVTNQSYNFVTHRVRLYFFYRSSSELRLRLDQK